MQSALAVDLLSPRTSTGDSMVSPLVSETSVAAVSTWQTCFGSFSRFCSGSGDSRVRMWQLLVCVIGRNGGELTDWEPSQQR